MSHGITWCLVPSSYFVMRHLAQQKWSFWRKGFMMFNQFNRWLHWPYVEKKQKWRRRLWMRLWVGYFTALIAAKQTAIRLTKPRRGYKKWIAGSERGLEYEVETIDINMLVSLTACFLSMCIGMFIIMVLSFKHDRQTAFRHVMLMSMFTRRISGRLQACLLAYACFSCMFTSSTQVSQRRKFQKESTYKSKNRICLLPCLRHRISPFWPRLSIARLSSMNFCSTGPLHQKRFYTSNIPTPEPETIYTGKHFTP